MMLTIMRLIVVGATLVVASPLFALTPNMPAGSLREDMLVQTRTGIVNCIVQAPRPRIVPFRGVARAVYAADINVGRGSVYSARVLQSCGNSEVDNQILNSLQQWQFRPRIIYKLVVPVVFKGSTVYYGDR
jgi:LEA14-like dessication related protein